MDELGPTKFDDAAWHDGPAAAAGRPREHAFTHIGIFLAWLIRHDLHDPRSFPPAHVRAIKAGSMTGSKLADDTDWKLVSDAMTADGAAFTAARYDAYMAAYTDLFGAAADYRVAETAALYERVAARIDALYEAWVEAGRPPPEPEEPSPLDARLDALLDAAAIPWHELPSGADGPITVQVNWDSSFEALGRPPSVPQSGHTLTEFARTLSRTNRRSGEMPMGADDAPYLDAQGRYLARDVDPADAGDGVATLLAYLERQRATLAWKCGGLDAAGLHSTHPPSSLTLGGALKHLARFEDDMSTEWLSGEPQLPPWNAVDWDAQHDWDWRTAAGDEPAELYARWQAAVDRSRALFAEAAARPAGSRPAEAPSLTYILLNMIEEYARHNGHADLIRESIDGLVGQDPPTA